MFKMLRMRVFWLCIYDVFLKVLACNSIRFESKCLWWCLCVCVCRCVCVCMCVSATGRIFLFFTPKPLIQSIIFPSTLQLLLSGSGGLMVREASLWLESCRIKPPPPAGFMWVVKVKGTVSPHRNSTTKGPWARPLTPVAAVELLSGHRSARHCTNTLVKTQVNWQLNQFYSHQRLHAVLHEPLIVFVLLIKEMHM